MTVKTDPHYAIGYTWGHIALVESALNNGEVDRALSLLADVKQVLKSAAPMLGGGVA